MSILAMVFILVGFSTTVYAHSGDTAHLGNRWFPHCQDEKALPFCGTLRVDPAWQKTFQLQAEGGTVETNKDTESRDVSPAHEFNSEHKTVHNRETH